MSNERAVPAGDPCGACGHAVEEHYRRYADRKDQYPCHGFAHCSCQEFVRESVVQRVTRRVHERAQEELDAWPNRRWRQAEDDIQDLLAAVSDAGPGREEA